MLLFNMLLTKTEYNFYNFNTSNVTIQHIRIISIPTKIINFNTSNVTIQLEEKVAYELSI